MPDELRFPAYRSDDWVRKIIDDHLCPQELLHGVDLTPAYMAANPSAALYANKARETREQIRRALFRHALFKVQNVEVTDSCRADRILTSVHPFEGYSLSRDFLDKISIEDTTKKIHEEVWEIDRCGSRRLYAVRYYREGQDGFSSKVFPISVSDKIAMLRYYFS